MMERLSKCHTEACDEILASVKAGRSISDAVTDAIEVLPASKTRGLRRWLEQWEDFTEWLKWEAKGWNIRRDGKDIIVIAPANDHGKHGQPSVKAIAAAADVPRVRFVIYDRTGRRDPQRREMVYWKAKSWE